MEEYLMNRVGEVGSIADSAMERRLDAELDGMSLGDSFVSQTSNATRYRMADSYYNYDTQIDNELFTHFKEHHDDNMNHLDAMEKSLLEVKSMLKEDQGFDRKQLQEVQ